jgi:hypothetical protein
MAKMRVSRGLWGVFAAATAIAQPAGSVPDAGVDAAAVDAAAVDAGVVDAPGAASNDAALALAAGPPPRAWYCTHSDRRTVGTCSGDRAECDAYRAAVLVSVPDLSPCTESRAAHCYRTGSELRCADGALICDALRATAVRDGVNAAPCEVVRARETDALMPIPEPASEPQDVSDAHLYVEPSGFYASAADSNAGRGLFRLAIGVLISYFRPGGVPMYHIHLGVTFYLSSLESGVHDEYGVGGELVVARRYTSTVRLGVHLGAETASYNTALITAGPRIYGWNTLWAGFDVFYFTKAAYTSGAGGLLGFGFVL